MRRLIPVATAALLISACVPSPPTPTAAPAAKPTEAAKPADKPAEVAKPAAAAAKTTVGEVKVGLLYPTTGPVATTGQAMVNGHILAADEINAAGGIKALGGARITHVIADTQGKAEIGLSQIRKLIEQDQVPVVQGAFQSPVTFATTQIAEQKQIPYIVPIGAADDITERGFQYTFKISPRGSRAAEDMLKLVDDLGKSTGRPAKTVALVYIDNLFGKNQADQLKKRLPAAGLEVVADLSYPEAVTDVSGVIAKLKAANPDVVLQSSYTQDGILISRAMADQNYAPTLGWIGFGGNAGDPQFFEAVGQQADNYLSIGFWLPSIKVPGVSETADSFKKRFNMEMDEYSAAAYTGTYVLADSLERAEAVDPQKIRDALSGANFKTGTKGNVFPFAITFPPDGQTPSYFIGYQSTNNQRVVVWPEEAAGSAKPTWPAILGTKK